MKIKFSGLVSLMALSIAGAAAYFSVFGLSQLFAGASLAVIIMASILEIGKVITTSLLQRYWNVLSKSLRVYLVLCVFILMLITSGGIYGFLSNAYQKTANKLELHEGELSVLESKKSSFEDAKNQKSNRREQLINLREKQEVRIDSAKTNKAKIRVEKTIEDANNEITKLDKDIDVLTDSINAYNTIALNLKSGSAVAAEVGPLKYLSELTGQPMGSIVNWFILLLIFVFDPLAVMLIIAANKLMLLESNDVTPQTIKKKEVTVTEELIETPEVVQTIIEPVSVNEEEIVIVEPVNTNERGFSVNIPIRKESNQVQRIGSNKEIRGGINNTVFFNKSK
jgi:hypothetical protein